MTLPVGVVPVSLGIFAVIMCASVLDVKKSLVAVAVYILLGSIGLPVFAGWQGGLGVLAGPTGGYIWSYVLVCAVMGRCNHPSSGRFVRIVRGAVSLGVCYICGLLQYMAVSGACFGDALAVCVYPFVIFDIIKILAAVLVGERIRIALIKNGFIN
jgi:biotin transport system substrate-specific component